MGKTVLPYRMAIEEEMHTWKHFRKTLASEEAGSQTQTIGLLMVNV